MNRLRPWHWLLLLLPMGLGVARLHFDVEVLNLLPQRAEVVRGLRLFQDHFSNAQELVVTVDSPEADTTESAARALAESFRGHPDLVDRATWQPPWLESPVQAAELVAFLWLNQSTQAVTALAQRLQGEGLTNLLLESRQTLATSFSPSELALRGYDPLRLMELPEDVGANPFGAGSGQELFASEEGTFRILFVEATSDLASYKDCLNWLGAIKRIESGLRQSGVLPATVRVAYTGRPAFVAEIAGGMERDMTASVGGTMVIIAVLFYLVHRRWKPLLWLVALLIFILVGTTALAGLLFGTLNVVSIGFAAILLGLSVDYGLVLYQEARLNASMPLKSVRREVAPSILWSALTTAAAFALLNLSSLPGLSQLGTMVSVGVLLAAALMLTVFLPPLFKNRAEEVPGSSAPATTAPPTMPTAARTWPSRGEIAVWTSTVLLLILTAFSVSRQPPQFDHTANALRPRHSPAYAAVATIKQRLNRPDEPLWLFLIGSTADEVARNLRTAQTLLQASQERGEIESYTLPTALWPEPERQRTNARVLGAIAPRKASVEQAMLSLGFTTNSLSLAFTLFDDWQHAAAEPSIYWPTNRTSRWVLGRVLAHQDNEFLALGLIHPKTQPDGDAEEPLTRPVSQSLREGLPPESMILSGWDMLGPSLFGTVQEELRKILLPMALIFTLCLGMAFRGWSGILLSLATILVSACGLLILMQIMGWKWNLLNLMALPLLLGAGVDYSIHVQMALRRHHGNVRLVRRGIGRALLLCAGTTATGFGSLAFSSNAGLAALGQVCAAGLVCCFVTAVYLLPTWGKKWLAKDGGENQAR